ncbi:MAG: PKD domain-containing protein [Bacteroidota bacterium]
MKRLLFIFISFVLINICPSLTKGQCVANFAIPYSLCTNGVLSFTDISTVNGSTIIKEIWDFGNGKPDTLTTLTGTVTRNYFLNGFYTVKLTIITAAGCTSTVSKNINVSIKPQVAFSVGDVETFCGYNQVTFKNESTISTGESLSLLWSFSDATLTSLDDIFKKKYASPTSNHYQTKLKVISESGCKDSLTKSVYVPNATMAAINVANRYVCSSDSVSVSVTQQSLRNSSLINRVWSWGDGTQQQDNNALNEPTTHKYKHPGRYYITYYYTTSTCNLAYTDSVDIRESPAVSFATVPQATGLCGIQNGTFVNQTTSSIVSPITYIWRVNNIFASDEISPQYTFFKNGSQNIQLRARQINNCITTLDTVIIITGIDPKPNGIFAYETDTQDLMKYNFFDLSTIDSGSNILNRYWNFGDGHNSQSTTDTISHKYASKGTYIAELITASSSGCSDTLSKSIIVDSIAVSLCDPSFTSPAYACFGSPSYFIDSSYIKAGTDSLVKQIWDFGDGTADTIYSNFYYTHPHTYNAPGIYNASLTIFTKRGCASTLTKNTTVRSLKANGDFTYTQIANCGNGNQTIQLTPVFNSYGPYINKWIYGDGTNSGNGNSTSSELHSYAPGTYTVKYLSRVSNCQATQDTITKTVLVLPRSKTDFIYSVDELDSKTIQFTDKSYSGLNSIRNVTWDFGDGTTSIEKDPKHTYSDYGSYIVKHSFVSDFTDCLPDTITYTINVDSLKVLSNTILQSNMGIDFWTGYGYIDNMRREGTDQSRPFMSLYLAANENPATVLVDIPNMPLSKKVGTGFPKVVYVPANSVVEVNNFPLGDSTDAYNLKNLGDSRLYYTGITDRAIRITSNQPIGVWEHIYGNNDVSGGTLLLPTKMWSSSYIVQSRGGTTNAGIPNSYFFVIAESDSTIFEFTPSNNIIDSSTATLFKSYHTAANIRYHAGTTYSILLNKGEVFNAMGMINSLTAVDLSGTKVVSTNPLKKIAVFGGNGRILINTTGCTNTSGSDNLIQQIFPKAVWGTKYLTVPTKTMESGVYRITVDDPTAVVSVNGTTLSPFSIINNKYYEITRNQPLKIESDKRMMVTQYVVTPVCPTYTSGNNGQGDPEMINLTPLKYGTKNVTIFSPTFKNTLGLSASYINVIVRKEGLASLQIDNSNMIDTGTSSFVSGAAYGNSALIGIQDGFKQHPGDANYSYAKIKVATGTTHTIKCDSAFVAIAYGMENGESIGYNVGFNFNAVPFRYQYLGTGDWTNSINWLGNKIPPNPLPMGSEIIISGICTLNTPQVIEDGARLVVESGGKLIVNQNLIIQQ